MLPATYKGCSADITFSHTKVHIYLMGLPRTRGGLASSITTTRCREGLCPNCSIACLVTTAHLGWGSSLVKAIPVCSVAVVRWICALLWSTNPQPYYGEGDHIKPTSHLRMLFVTDYKAEIWVMWVFSDSLTTGNNPTAPSRICLCIYCFSTDICCFKTPISFPIYFN